ncbi:hypothetical protein FI667_g9040, partial [Globisporangium splendens]
MPHTATCIKQRLQLLFTYGPLTPTVLREALQRKLAFSPLHKVGFVLESQSAPCSCVASVPNTAYYGYVGGKPQAITSTEVLKCNLNYWGSNYNQRACVCFLRSVGADFTLRFSWVSLDNDDPRGSPFRPTLQRQTHGESTATAAGHQQSSSSSSSVY